MLDFGRDNARAAADTLSRSAIRAKARRSFNCIVVPVRQQPVAVRSSDDGVRAAITPRPFAGDGS